MEHKAGQKFKRWNRRARITNKLFNTCVSQMLEHIQFLEYQFDFGWQLIICIIFRYHSRDTSSVLVVILDKSTIPKVEVFFHSKPICQLLYIAPSVMNFLVRKLSI